MFNLLLHRNWKISLLSWIATVVGLAVIAIGGVSAEISLVRFALSYTSSMLLQGMIILAPVASAFVALGFFVLRKAVRFDG
jgi:hypothetical protein